MIELFVVSPITYFVVIDLPGCALDYACLLRNALVSAARREGVELEEGI